MTHPCLEDLLEFEGGVFYPQGIEISKLEHFPCNFNPFILRQYLADSSQHPQEYLRLTAFYKEVLLPLREKRDAVLKELEITLDGKKENKQKLTAIERLESLLLLPYTAMISSGDYIRRITGSTLVGSIASGFAGLAIWWGSSKIGLEAQVACIASVIAGIYKSGITVKTQINKLTQHHELFLKRMDELNRRILAEHPLVFGRGYDDLDTLGREIYQYFEKKGID